MLGISRLTLAEQVRRAGLPGMVGLALSACAAIAGLSVLLPARRQLDETRLAVTAARPQLHASGRYEQGPASAEEQLARFYERFPARRQAPQLLEQVYQAASDFGLQVLHADYVIADEREAGLVSYRVLVPLTGQYGQIRGFVERVLQSVPTLAVDELGLSRERASENRLDVRLRLNLYMTRT